METVRQRHAPDRLRYASERLDHCINVRLSRLIGIGVRCVIAAGWAVDDAGASTFATTFYDAILNGRRFLDAVADAREAAQLVGGNTWAAYQCYGDPDWIFRRDAADAQGVASPLNEFAGIASSIGLENALETLLTKHTDDLLPSLQTLIEDRSLRGSAIRGLAAYSDPGTGGNNSMTVGTIDSSSTGSSNITHTHAVQLVIQLS